MTAPTPLPKNVQNLRPKTLSPAQIKAIGVLLSTGNQTTAATAAGVTPRTIREWLGQAAFASAWRVAAARSLTACTARLTPLVAQALDVLEAGMSDRDFKIKLQSACALLRHGTQAFESVVTERRIQALEKRLSIGVPEGEV